MQAGCCDRCQCRRVTASVPQYRVRWPTATVSQKIAVVPFAASLPQNRVTCGTAKISLKEGMDFVTLVTKVTISQYKHVDQFVLSQKLVMKIRKFCQFSNKSTIDRSYKYHKCEILDVFSLGNYAKKGWMDLNENWNINRNKIWTTF